ncbi:MAG: hypothetical protein ACRCZW_00075 [Lactobacillaceae bacterium]
MIVVYKPVVAIQTVKLIAIVSHNVSSQATTKRGAQVDASDDISGSISNCSR